MGHGDPGEDFVARPTGLLWKSGPLELTERLFCQPGWLVVEHLHHVTGLDPDTGQRRFHLEVDASVAFDFALVEDSLLLFRDVDGQRDVVERLDPVTGETLWSRPSPERSYRLRVRGRRAVVLHEGRLICYRLDLDPHGADFCKLWAVSPGERSTQWSVSSAHTRVATSPRYPPYQTTIFDGDEGRVVAVLDGQIVTTNGLGVFVRRGWPGLILDRYDLDGKLLQSFDDPQVQDNSDYSKTKWNGYAPRWCTDRVFALTSSYHNSNGWGRSGLHLFDARDGQPVTCSEQLRTHDTTLTLPGGVVVFGLSRLLGLSTRCEVQWSMSSEALEAIGVARPGPGEDLAVMGGRLHLLTQNEVLCLECG